MSQAKNGSATLVYYYVLDTKLHQLMSRRIGVGWARRGRSELSKHTTFETETDFAAAKARTRRYAVSYSSRVFLFLLVDCPIASTRSVDNGKAKTFCPRRRSLFPLVLEVHTTFSQVI